MIPPSVLDRSLAVPDGGGGDPVWSSANERRRTRRAALHWTVYVIGHETNPFRTMTRDISRDGFYIVLQHPIAPGERIECDIVVPTHASLPAGAAVCLRCRAEIVRVEQTDIPGQFGVACRIDDYRLVYGVAEQNSAAT